MVPSNFLVLGKIWPLLDLLVKFKRVLTSARARKIQFATARMLRLSLKFASLHKILLCMFFGTEINVSLRGTDHNESQSTQQ